MKLETFFDQFAKAPDAVAKMQELVRHLAVKGKLLEPVASEEPAANRLSALLSALPA